MQVKHGRKNLEKMRNMISHLVLAAIFSVCICQAANAQGFAPPAPPPVGDGPTPAPVAPGDLGGAPAVSTGQSDPTPGHSFPTGIGRDRTRVQLFHSDSRGRRMVQTIRPDQLSNDELSRIEGILGASLRTGEQVIDADVSDAQLAQINDALAPYATGESPGVGYPRTNSLWTFVDADHPVPTVRRFARYLVILGVVSATIFMALAAWSMVLGHPYGASRVIGAVAGMMLLLSAYTIYKIVQLNTTNSNSDAPAQINRGATTAQVNNAFRPNVPATPGGATSNGRSGFPVQPLRNAQN